MTFSKKIFISVFLTTFLLGTAIIWSAHRYVSSQTRQTFISRYSVFSKVMGDTLTRLDKSTEALMLNAAKVVAAKDASEGLLTTDTLKSMRDELSVTHIFVVDKEGNFIRSTNEDPHLIPNAYSFCQGYRNMIAGSSNMESTPIIHPKPEPKPYKFLFIPNKNRQRLLEVGVRVDFVAKTLSEALGSDSNIVSMALYSPDGTPFGRFKSKDVDFSGPKTIVPAVFPKVVDSGDTFKFFTKVESSHPQCCQCDVSKTSRNGEYYYVLESEVSKKELSAILATTKTAFGLLGFGNLILAFLFGRLLSRRLVRNIEMAAKRVRDIRKHGDVGKRLHLDGKDEVAYLTKEFDRLLDSLEDSQKKLIETERLQMKVQLANEVAHNIRSPIVAIEMMMPMLARLPDKIQKVFRDSAREIKLLSERLNKQADSSPGSRDEFAHVPTLLESVVNQKQIEFSAHSNTVIEFINRSGSNKVLSKMEPTEFCAVISNLVNNAVESYPGKSGKVLIEHEIRDATAMVSVVDEGKGIPEEYLSQLGSKQITVGKEYGRGIGLLHASRVIKSWGGEMKIESSVPGGTIVSIYLKKIRPSTTEVVCETAPIPSGSH